MRSLLHRLASQSPRHHSLRVASQCPHTRMKVGRLPRRRSSNMHHLPHRIIRLPRFWQPSYILLALASTLCPALTSSSDSSRPRQARSPLSLRLPDTAKRPCWPNGALPHVRPSPGSRLSRRTMSPRGFSHTSLLP